METFLYGFLLPLLLLSASLLDWSLISLVDLIAFLAIQYIVTRRDFHLRKIILFLWSLSIFSLLVALAQAIIVIVLAIKSGDWSLMYSSWMKLVGFMRFESWRSPTAIFSSVIQLLVGLVCLAVLYQHKLGSLWRISYSGRFSSIFLQLGSYFKVVSCFLLPAIQLVVGISHPSWVSLPFFICSCVGLVDWSLTSNFSGLFRWWRPLQLYAGVNILLLYAYQLPVGILVVIQPIAKFVGLYKISAESGWLELCSGLSLITFYTLDHAIKSRFESRYHYLSKPDLSLSYKPGGYCLKCGHDNH